MTDRKRTVKTVPLKKSNPRKNKKPAPLFTRWRRRSVFFKAASFTLMFGVVGVITILLARAAAPDPTWKVPLPNPDHSTNTILLKFKDNVPSSVQDKLLTRFSARTKKTIPQIGVKVITVPDEALDAILEALSYNPVVQFAEKDYLAVPEDLTPNDPYFPSTAKYGGQWVVTKAQAPKAWDTTTGSANVLIAIVDSGVAQHPDLVGNIVAGHNVLDGSANTNDTFGHGTQVAGTAAEVGNNAVGSVGFCFSCKILPVKVYTSSSGAYVSDMASGVTWAADHGAKVINISIAGPNSSSTLSNAINYARQRSASVVAAAGNYGSSAMQYPAGLPGVISVAGSDQVDNLYGYSTYGTWVKVAAPGQPITTTLTDPSTGTQWGYTPVGGTSMASPAVAGILGLLRSAQPTASLAQIEQALLSSSDVCCGGKIGGGRVNAYKAILSLTGVIAPPPADTTAPDASITAPANGSTISGQVSINISATDNVGITKIELYRNGGLVGTTTTSPYGLFWDTTTNNNGSYSLTAKAYDASGNVGSSSPVTVTVNNTAVITDTIAPTVSISSPTNGASIGNNVTVKASATDNVGVRAMEVYIDGMLRASSTSGSITANKLNTRKLPAGSHTITVKAYDAAGNVGQSGIIVNK
jgi:thermitase